MVTEQLETRACIINTSPVGLLKAYGSTFGLRIITLGYSHANKAYFFNFSFLRQDNKAFMTDVNVLNRVTAKQNKND